MDIKVIGQTKQPDYKVYAKSLDDAYNKKYFCNSMTRYELMDRVTKYNPQLRWHSSATHRGLFDTDNSKYVCGIGHNVTIPQWTIMRESDGYVFMRSWRSILNEVKRRGYEIDEKGL